MLGRSLSYFSRIRDQIENMYVTKETWFFRYNFFKNAPGKRLFSCSNLTGKR